VKNVETPELVVSTGRERILGKPGAFPSADGQSRFSLEFDVTLALRQKTCIFARDSEYFKDEGLEHNVWQSDPAGVGVFTCLSPGSFASAG
jgi:hypothetical protein